MVEDVQYAGVVEVQRVDGTRVAEAKGARSRHGNLNLYSENYLRPDPTEDRNAAIGEMLGNMVRAIDRVGATP